MKNLILALATMILNISAWSQCLTITCPPNLTNDCTSAEGAVVNFAPTVNSTCGGGTAVNCTPPSGSLFPIGTTTVTCRAQNVEFQFASCSFTITVKDLSPPSIQAPRLVQAPCTGPAGGRVTFQVSATDNVSSNVLVSCTPASGSFFPVGTNTVVCSAVDEAGLRRIVQFPVLVSGDCPSCLVLTRPARIELLAGRYGTATTNFLASGVVTASNTCGGRVELICEPPPETPFPVGTNIVVCSATDGAGSFVEQQFPVIVRDVTPPALTLTPLIERECKGTFPFPGAQVWYPPFTVFDNADPKPTVVYSPPSGTILPLGTNVVTVTATDDSGNSSVRTFLAVVTSGPKCDSVFDPDDLTLAPDNWGFELGNLAGWTDSGDAFGDQPLLGHRITAKRIGPLSQQMSNSVGGDYWRDVTYPIGFKGSYWVGTGDSPAEIFSDEVPGLAQESRTGTLLSKRFQINRNYITFLLGGQEDHDGLRLELLIETNAGPNLVQIGSRTYRVVFYETGHNTEAMRRENFPVQQWLGAMARIRIIDNSSTGHLNVDDFRFQDTPPGFTSVKVAGTNILEADFSDGYYYDWDAPVWGFADMHTHPMSYLGFGGKLMHGKLDGDIETALGDCNPDHGGQDIFGGNPEGDYYRQLLTAVMDSHGPSPHREGYVENEPWKRFRNWPVFHTITHQQMWHTWMRRAYDGGERVIVALCVNNPLLAQVSKGHLPKDDLRVGTNQIAAMKAFVARHNDFMEIAYDPFQLRQIVRGNRMAVILGSELDDIGNLCQDSSVHTFADETSKIRVRVEIDRLHHLGIRYIFPVHLMDNKFGGTAIAGDMLNIASKHLNGFPFDAEPSPASEGINLKLDHLDYTDEAIGAGVAAAVFGPTLPLLAAPLLEAFTGPVVPGAGTAIGLGVLPIALIGGVNEILLNAIGVEPMPPSIWPIGNNFPDYGNPSWGHRNKRGLTPLGEFAVMEMMKRGIMLDIDHMGYHTLSNVLARAEAVPGGYPLNSGHNSFRALHHHTGENSRTIEHLVRLRDLGGIMGVGYENSEALSYPAIGDEPSNIYSDVPNDCAGTSKSFAQHYLYALERLGGRQIAFGTDINGLIPGPGPRFGPQSAFGLEFQPEKRRVDQIAAQRNGILYEPRHGLPLTTPAFVGKGMDPDRNEDRAREDEGYKYNKEQAAFFAALRIFLWQKTISENELNTICDAMSDSYPDKGRIKELARGLVKAHAGDTDGSDTEKIAGAVYRKQALGINCPDEIVHDSEKFPRYGRLSRVWHDYHYTFGNNTPMKRCVTAGKSWDFNFEGVAHYGLIPDLLQDLRNAALDSRDLSPLFQSADDFAKMWLKCLGAAHAINHPVVQTVLTPVNQGVLVQWFGEESDIVEETTDLTAGVWERSEIEIQTLNGRKVAAFQIESNAPPKFFRVRKQ